MENTNTPKLAGVIVFYVNVGMLPPKKGEEFVKTYKKNLKDEGFLDKMKENGYEVIFVPNRDVTHVELLKF